MMRLEKIISLSILCVLAASCSKERRYGEFNIPNDEEKATITFNVRTPGMNRRGSTRAFPAGYEENIDDITIFLARDDGSGFIMDSMVVVDRFRHVNSTTRAFTLELPTSAIPTKVFVAANLMDADNGLCANYNAGFTTANGKGFDETAFIRYLTDEWAEVGADASGSGAVCMYMAGSAVLPSIKKGEANLHIPLLRWVARADVNIDLDADSKSFVPTSVTSWHGYRDACVFADGTAYDSENAARVLHPTLAGATRLAGDSGIDVPVSGTSGLIATTYLGEHDEMSSYEDKLDTPCLILGGYFDGSDTESFYRIDFDSGLDGHPFGQVLRNWQYVFNVTKIMSSGYDSPEEAAANPAHSIVIEVQMWDENVQQVDFAGTGDYMYVNTLDVSLSYDQGAQNTFVVRSTLPFGWGFDTTNMLSQASDMTLTDADFSVSVTARDTSDTTCTDYTFTVIALADNISNAQNESLIFITARDATMSIRLVQKVESVTERTIRVLSLTDNIGSQGVYHDGGDGNTLTTGMRTILTNPTWFGPTGRVKCGGFTFDRFQTGDMTPTSSVDLDRLQHALDDTDILVTTYAGDPSQSVVDLILDWARKPYHVLFVAADAGGTSTNYGSPTNVLLRESLKNNPVFNSGLTWYDTSDLGNMDTAALTTDNTRVNAAFGTDYLRKLADEGGLVLQSGEPLHVSVKSVRMADQTDENLTFTAGPFGLPDQGMLSTPSSYKIWDDASEWAVLSDASSVIPLLVVETNVFGWNSAAPVTMKTDAMMVGVDTALAVVYMGEIRQIDDYPTAAPPSGFAPGLANSPYHNSLSVLMSNIWAWAVENVLAQIKDDNGD